MELAFLVLLGAGAFWSGLYSAGQQLLLTALLALMALRLPSQAVISRLEAAALALLTVGVALSFRSPAAAGMAAHGPVIVAGWLLAFLAGRRCTDREGLFRALSRMLAVLGPLMVFGGLAGMSYLPAHHSGRLASFVGYPIAVGLLGMLGLAGSLPLLAERRWWAPVLAFGNGAAFFLSGSRGVWLVGLCLAAYLLWAAPALLRRTLVPLAAALGVALAAALWTGPAVEQQQMLPALAPVLLGGLTMVGGVWLQKFGFRRWLATAGFLLWIAAMALAPGWGWFLGRATALSLSEGSSVERLTFIRDGLAISRGLPLGAGYRAWTALHLQRASYDYYSAEVHSAPLDIGLAFGWLGAAGFLLMLGRSLLGLRAGRTWSPERLAVLAGIAALGVHALADWDLSYGFFAGLLWLGFGLAGFRSGREATAAPSSRLAAPGSRPVTLPFGLTATLAALALAAALVLGAGDIFESLAERAVAAGQFDLAYRHARMAASITPWQDTAHAEAGLALRAFRRDDEAAAEFQAARRLGPYEPWYAVLAAQTAADAGRVCEAAADYREFVRLWPWYVPAYEEALQAHVDMLLRAQLTGDQRLAADLVASGRSILSALDHQKAREPKKTPRAPMNLDTPIIRAARDRFH